MSRSAAHFASDLVEEGDQTAHVCGGEDGIQHLALLFVLSTIRCEQARSQREAYTAAIQWTVRIL